MKQKGRHPKRLCQKLLLVMMMMMIGCSATLTSNDLFNLKEEKTRSLPVLAAAPLHSITACAEFCTTFKDCAAFNLKVPVGAKGNLRLCEATKDDKREPDSTFNTYKKVTTTKIVPLVTVYKSFDIPRGDDGCDSDKALTTIVFNPADATNSDIDHIICGKIDKPWKQHMDKDVEHRIKTIEGESETCKDNKVLQGFESDDDEWRGYDKDMKGRCHLLEDWKVDTNVCEDAFPTNNLSYYPDVYVDSDHITEWNSWITCPYFHFAVGIKRREIGDTDRYKILSMKCCKIIGP